MSRTLLLERYASAKDFLIDLTELHGSDAYQVNQDSSFVLARCPACPTRPKLHQQWEQEQYPWRPAERDPFDRYLLWVFPTPAHVEEPSWDWWAWCGCEDARIYAAFLQFERDKLAAQARSLDATIQALREKEESPVN